MYFHRSEGADTIDYSVNGHGTSAITTHVYLTVLTVLLSYMNCSVFYNLFINCSLVLFYKDQHFVKCV